MFLCWHFRDMAVFFKFIIKIFNRSDRYLLDCFSPVYITLHLRPSVVRESNVRAANHSSTFLQCDTNKNYVSQKPLRALRQIGPSRSTYRLERRSPARVLGDASRSWGGSSSSSITVLTDRQQNRRSIEQVRTGCAVLSPFFPRRTSCLSCLNFISTPRFARTKLPEGDSSWVRLSKWQRR